MRKTGSNAEPSKLYRCSVGEGGVVRLPQAVCYALQLRPGHQVDFQVTEDHVEVFHARPCCQLCGRSEALYLVLPVFVCKNCLDRIRALDLSRPPLPDDLGLLEE